MNNDYSEAIKSFVRMLDNDGIYKEKPYAFISYSHAVEDVKQIYPFLIELFKKGYALVLDTEYAEMNDSWVNGMTKRVYDSNCKIMLTFSSRSYMYSRPSLIEQYSRYSKTSRKSHDCVIPYAIVDTADDEHLNYMDVPDPEMMERTKLKTPGDRYALSENSESAECLKNGLTGFYLDGGDSPMVGRIINSEYSALQKFEDIDEIRRQMRFVLRAEDYFQDCCNINKADALERVINQLEASGIKGDESIQKKAERHFLEWGSEYYEYIADGSVKAKMKYNPREKMFELICRGDGTLQEGNKSQDIVEITRWALGQDITNPEEYWINTGDHKSLRSKHGYFSDFELTEEQENIHKRVLGKIRRCLDAGEEDHEWGQVIMIQGDAGTGKTVLAQRIFTDLKKEYPAEDCYFVVNHKELLSQYQNELAKYDIPKDRVNVPASVLLNIEGRRKKGEEKPSVIFVDEAHLMLTQNTQDYTGKNKTYLIGDHMVADMRRNARIVVLMFDRNQILQARQVWQEEALNAIVDDAIENGNFALLKRQMRITASQDVIAWIASFVGEQHKLLPIPKDEDYDFRIFRSVKDMYALIRQCASEEENKHARIVATFDWDYAQGHGAGADESEPWMVSVPSENWSLPWNDERSARKDFFQGRYKKNERLPWIEQDYSLDEVGSTFSVQGFDMPYVGVILGPSISYDKDLDMIKVTPENCRDKKARNTRTFSDGTQLNFTEMLVWNAVNILLTRGRKGLFIYAVDDDLREALLVASGETNIVNLPFDCSVDISNAYAWRTYSRRSYEVGIQKADMKCQYNVDGKPGYVYNHLEQTEASVEAYDYVITGIVGEMWPVHASALAGYDIKDDQTIGKKMKKIWSKTNDIVYYAVQIPVEYQFQVQLASGVVLNGNADGVDHADGDFILCTSFERKDYRVINGSIFDKMYELNNV